MAAPRFFTPINRAGWPFIGLFAGATALAAYWWAPALWLGGALTIGCAYFFRDPARVTPRRDGLIISPADGIVLAIGPAPPPPEVGAGDAPRMRISIFMNIFDVHVNRAPVSGRVAQLAYRPGKFFNASLDKASSFNERQAIRLTMNDGLELIVVQIAGLIARRIVCHLAPEQQVTAGERFGLIRFGSRLDVYLPDGVAPLACVGQRTVAGETVLADIRAQEAARKGEAS